MAETAVARCREACRANPDSAAVRMELADALGALAEARHGRGETTSAIEAAAESFALLHDMAGRPFAGTATLAAAAGAAGRLAELESRAGRHDSATHHADLELSLRAAIAERTGSSSEAVAALQRARCRAGEVLLRAGQPDPAIGYAREAIDWARRTLRTASQDAAAQAVLGHGLLLRAEAEHARGRAREADAAAAEAVGVLRQLSEREGWPKDLVGLLARAYRAAGRPADAEALEGRHDPRQ
jgi:tetratricopeptide (TPR) repeat protein